MSEFSKISALIGIAQSASANTTVTKERFLCSGTIIVANSLRETCDSFKSLFPLGECIADYLRGTIHGKAGSLNQFALLLSAFFPGVELVTIDEGILIDELMKEGEAECQS